MDLDGLDLHPFLSEFIDLFGRIGTPFDYFDPLANTKNDTISATARQNRKLLLEEMDAAGFVNYPYEWWHFTFRSEPFPETYFDFPIRFKSAADVPPISAKSLCGDYAYYNREEHVTSLGTISFDGAGHVFLDIRINSTTNGGAGTQKATGRGSYTVGENGLGRATLRFDGIMLEEGAFDFLVMETSDGIAKVMQATLDGRGVVNQAVDPVWKLRSPGRC